MDIGSTIERIRNDSVGYFYSWGADKVWSFGSEPDKALLPMHVMGVPPLSFARGFAEGYPIHYFFDFHSVTQGSMFQKELERRSETNKDKIILCSVPLPKGKIVSGWKKYDEMERQFSSHKSPYVPTASSVQEYEKLLEERFYAPFLTFHRSRGVRRGKEFEGSYEFYFVGEKESAHNFNNLLLEYPNQFKEIISRLTGAPVDYLHGYNYRNNLFVRDESRSQKEQSCKVYLK